METLPLTIDEQLVYKLVATQFPQWKNLPVKAIAKSGWDNRTFRLGTELLVRLPSAVEYAPQVQQEQFWLPKLTPHLPLEVPEPIALGKPGFDYPWDWSIYRWIEGEPTSSGHINDLPAFAKDLAHFLNALQRIDATGGQHPSAQNFYRGGPLRVYDAQIRQAINILKDKIDTTTALNLWESALRTNWQGTPVWVHGDISAGNLLVRDGKLAAVIDFGQLAVGDPACDLAIAWTLFDSESRKVFRKELACDNATWNRGQAWALWKTLITAARLSETNAVEKERCWHTISEILNA